MGSPHSCYQIHFSCEKTTETTSHTYTMPAKQTKIQNNTKERHRSQLGFFLFGLLDADRGPILCFLTRGGNCSVSAIAVATRINFLPSLSDGIIRIDGEVIGMMVGAASCGLRFRNVTSSLLLRLES